MSLRDWADISYLPIISLRPAEMRALEELPNRTKDRLLPITHLRPWTTSHQMENGTRRLAQAYGDRPIVVAMGDREAGTERPVHGQLEALRHPADGFRAWCSFLQSNANYIPAIQFSPAVAEEEAQISRLYRLSRGLVVIIERPVFSAIETLTKRVGRRTQDGKNVCFVVDFGFAGKDYLQTAGQADDKIKIIKAYCPAAFIAISASSFPPSFVGVNKQPIFERVLFDGLPDKDRLIYSDRGSARVERQMGGGGQPAPRVDYPLPDSWRFERSEDATDFQGYVEQAVRVMRSGVWNPNLRVWGTQMIERTAAGDMSAISSPLKATAARINLHLQRQAFYSDPKSAEDTDEDWEG